MGNIFTPMTTSLQIRAQFEGVWVIFSILVHGNAMGIEIASGDFGTGVVFDRIRQLKKEFPACGVAGYFLCFS